MFLLSPRQALRVVSMLPRVPPPQLPTEVWGIQFPNPVGLAAGADKNGVATDGWGTVGFGFQELGSVTCEPYKDGAGTVERLTSDTIYNRVGLNNDGVWALRLRLMDRRSTQPLGVSVAGAPGRAARGWCGDY